MILIIAEKPSVAAEIARVVGAEKREDGYRIGNGYIVSWCFGHLIAPAQPAAYDEALKRWDINTLPIIPDEFRYEVSEKTKKQFDVLKSLMDRSDVNRLIEATDAGREGELIFRLVYHQAKCQKPFSRLWISSMETNSIKEGLREAKPSTEYDNLYLAALCRQHADWLYGINFTRLYTCMYGTKLPCGRVQTPTVKLIVDRQEEIKNFVPETYYSIIATLNGFKAYSKQNSRRTTMEMLERCNGAEAVVTKVATEEKSEKPPKLYDLTLLQRDANRLLGYTAKQTLDYAQSLYEKKLLTYPRTDSNYLTEDQAASSVELVEHIINNFNVLPLKNFDVKNANIAQVINNKKVSDHHALLPTKNVSSERLEELPQGERLLLLLVIYRLMVAVSPPYRYKSTVAVLDIEGYSFRASGQEIIDSSFKSLEAAVMALSATNAEKVEREPEALPPMSEGNTFSVMQLTMEERHTTPKPSYTEDTLLKAMERAGSEIEDDELRKSIWGSGLGTPATRAGIIENIINSGYVRREGKKLIATDTAYSLMDIVIDDLKSPTLTAKWEQQLDGIQKGEILPDKFMSEISIFLRTFISDIEMLQPDKNVFCQEKPQIGVCPMCGKKVVEYTSSYSCESGKTGCSFSIWKTILGKALSEVQVRKLLEKGKSDLIKGFTSKSGKRFDAYLILKEGSVQFEFPPNSHFKKRS